LSVADETPGTVGVLGGTGPLGRGVGLRLALAGHRVVLGSRTPERAATIAKELTAEFDVADGALTGGGNAEAAEHDIVVVAVPFDGVRPLLDDVGDRLAGRIVVSCVNRLGFDGTGPHPVPVDEGSAAELVATLAPGARVVGAFHHLPAGRLTSDAGPLDMDVLVTGDDADAVAAVCSLAEDLGGVRGVPAGALRLSRPLEELTAVVIAVNKRYRVTAGVRLTGLPDGA
jgi:NADPH-dependent F420 reductase